MERRGNDSPSKVWVRLAEATVRQTMQELPADLRARLHDVPILFENRPGPQLQEDGWPDDLLGLFEGPCHGERALDVSVQPPAITLFLENLQAEANGDSAIFRQEVRTTLLHEIGHYLGLDENDLIARNLE